MKSISIVANFKSNQTQNEAEIWLEEFKNIDLNLLSEKEIILCPSFTLLPLFREYLLGNNLNVKLGAQNISAFSQGPYTGEINGKQIKELAGFVLIGHSERRSLLKEDDDMILKKVNASLENGLTPIFFVQNTDTIIPSGVEVAVYEPPSSISDASGGVADDPKKVFQAVGIIRGKYSLKTVLYGGSVNSANIKNFTLESGLNGAVVGVASLEASEFIKVIQNA